MAVVDEASATTRAPSIAVVHDYLTQRGGAERVLISMANAFPGAKIYTSLYAPELTFEEFDRLAVQTSALNSFPLLRRRHRAALPFLARTFARWSLAEDLVLCSSSGWAHGIGAVGKKLVYCHSPAKWIYERGRYARGRPIHSLAARVTRAQLYKWDQAAAASAHAYLANSRRTQAAIYQAYGIEAEVLHPPHRADAGGQRNPVAGVEESHTLCVARLLSYKNVDAVIAAFERMPDERLTVVGVGPEFRRYQMQAPRNVRLLGSVSDAQLRWLYASCKCLIAVAQEDFGLTPLEAAAFGKPTIALRSGGYLDTVVEGETGIFVSSPQPRLIVEALRMTDEMPWSASKIIRHAAAFGEAEFCRRLQRAARKVMSGGDLESVDARTTAA